MDGGRGIAGTPESVIKALSAQLAEAGVNYCVGQFVFGDMSAREAHKSDRPVRARGDAGACGNRCA